jgi:hypothetical protein
VTLAFLSDASLPAGWDGPLNKRDAVVAMSVLDALGGAAFFAAALALAVVNRRLCAQVGQRGAANTRSACLSGHVPGRGCEAAGVGGMRPRRPSRAFPRTSEPAPEAPTTGPTPSLPQADSSTVTIHDYSIRVERLPQDASAEELVAFFGQYGEASFCVIRFKGGG